MKDLYPIPDDGPGAAPLTADHYRQLLDSLLTVVFTLDGQGRFVYVNAAAQEVWGYSAEELAGRCCLELVWEADREKTARYLQDHQEGHDVAHFQNLFYRKDGSLVPVSWAGRWAEGEGRFYAVVRDFTERRNKMALQEQYREELEKQSAGMFSILERITDGFFALDQQWRVIYWNKEAEWMLGRAANDVLGKNLWELFPDAVATPFYVNYHKAYNEQVAVYFEGYYGPRDIWAEVSVYPSHFGLSVFFKNINERKRLEKELRAHQRQMTAAVIGAQEKERTLISGELHDNVNQLLTSAKLYATLVRDGVDSPAVMIDKTIVLVQQAIDEIRQLSRRLSDPFLHHAVLEDSVRELVNQIAATNRLSITLHAETEGDTAMSAEVKLAVYRILQEHLTNILKHAAASEVEVTLQQTGQKVLLAVVDNGKGFDPAKCGGGVGLSSMRMRAESLMGIFCLDSRPGGGCTLVVQLPLGEGTGDR